jgi:hypothetical protein
VVTGGGAGEELARHDGPGPVDDLRWRTVLAAVDHPDPRRDVVRELNLVGDKANVCALLPSGPVDAVRGRLLDGRPGLRVRS